MKNIVTQQQKLCWLENGTLFCATHQE